MVFEYMDHDLTGLSDRPGMRFTIAQIKVKTIHICV
jgi:cyclin-dependent kinase 12/13